MKIKYFIILSVVLTLNACSNVRDSAGVTRKSIDEFQVVENPPLVIPPDFNLLPPDQLEEKNIDDEEKELAQEIASKVNGKLVDFRGFVLTFKRC